MALPQRIVPGTRYLLTRRCTQREFRLRPSRETTQIIAYALARALEKTGVLLHAACAMSNHLHLIVTDVRGVLPDFLRELHRTIAKALNLVQEHSENFWSSDRCNPVALSEDADVIAEVAYVAANPVAAGLVEVPEQWPGLQLWKEGSQEVERPKVYFSSREPARICLPVTSPARSPQDAPRWSRAIRAAVQRRVVDAHARLRANGQTFLGRRRVLARRIDDKPKSDETTLRHVPRFTAKQRHVREHIVAELRAFHLAYRAALDAWRAGRRGVTFPRGTWWMRVHHRARTHSDAAADFNAA